jgi:type I restriction enzyme S subunit
VELLAEKRQAVISHAVSKGLNPNVPMKDSGIEWLGEVPEHWATPAMYMRYSSELGKMLDSSKITGEHLIPYMRNVDVQWGAINFDDLPYMDIHADEYERYIVKAGDLLVCEGGEVGRTAIVPEVSGTFGYQKALHRLRALDASEDSTFMYFTFLWAENTGIFDQSGSSTIAHLTGDQLRKYRFPKPPVAEQREISAYLKFESTKFDTLTCEANRAIELLQERRTALISAAVTGKIDVREQ